jgi:hypothetical protein
LVRPGRVITNRPAIINKAARKPAPESHAKIAFTWALVPFVVKGTVDDVTGR